MRRLLIFLMAATLAWSYEQHGQVLVGGVPVPGATLTAHQGDTKVVVLTDERGVYSFPDLREGRWTIDIEMTGFAAVHQEIAVGPNAAAGKWQLQLRPAEEIMANAARTAPPVATTPEPAKPESTGPDHTEEAIAGLLINGSVNNGAASPFSQSAAFGNNRKSPRALYNGSLGLILDNSVLDAQPYSLTGQNTAKPSYNNLTGVLTFGGPIRIPHLIRNGPVFFVAYQWTRDRNSSTQSALVPDAAERTGVPFSIPQSRISPQALALLNLYPLPNFTGSSLYNYQIATVSPMHRDDLQSRFDKTLNNKNQLNGKFALQSLRARSPNVLGFSDTSDSLGINTGINWQHRISRQVFLILGYQFSRFANHATPYFANRTNVSGKAGIQGNDQSPVNWGPPALVFSNGIVGLSDGLFAFDRNQTSAESVSILWSHGLHAVTVGGDFRRQQFNHLSQQNPRGAFTFTGATTGDAFADFLLGTPDTSSIAFGNADKYMRGGTYDGYAADDWRVRPELTLNLGVRWEYGSPQTERYDRLVNLALTPGFQSATAVQHSLLKPDKKGWEPRLGLAWRPISGSSLVVRAGYGIYYDTSVYSSITTQLAQQPPLSKALSVQNSAATPLTLANGFNQPPTGVANTFAIDPNFRVGYAQNWQLSLQTDLPRSLQLVVSYLGIKGTRGLQEVLPNTVPIGALNPCLSCPLGFVYLTSNGNSTRESGRVQLRRRLHNGFTATAQYTFSKSIDDVAALGGQGAATSSQFNQAPTAANPASGTQGGAPTAATSAGSAMIAQDWRNLHAERGLSTFDQRHQFSLQMQYTSGMGAGGGTLMSGWLGTLLKEWTFSSQLTLGSGLPLSPIYLAAVPGTGFTGTIRPAYSGAPLYAAPEGLSLNPAAYAVPAAGEWGNAGRNSITGPAQFSFDSAMGRTFRLKDHYNLDLRVDSTNALNHVTYTSWNTIVNSAQFGFPVAANSMRSLQTTLRLRF